MTPSQQRQATPLRQTTTAEKMANAANVCITSVWPLSAIHAASLAYCDTINSKLDPHPCGEPLVDGER
jgi:hypothetical protein